MKNACLGLLTLAFVVAPVVPVKADGQRPSSQRMRAAPVAASLCVLLACDGAAQRQTSSPTSAYSASATERKLPAGKPTELERFECAADGAVAEVRVSKHWSDAFAAWVREVDPLMDQFKFTLWAEIPEGARSSIVALDAQKRKEGNAKWAIDHRVPVSSVSSACNPDAPHCSDLSHPDSQRTMGLAYAIVVRRQLGRVIRSLRGAVESRGHLDSTVAALTPSGEAAGSLAKVRAEHYRAQLSVIKERDALLAALPKSAVLPKLELPPAAPRPLSCRGR